MIGINILADEGRRGFFSDIFWKHVCIIEDGENSNSDDKRLSPTLHRESPAPAVRLQFRQIKRNTETEITYKNRPPLGVVPGGVGRVEM